MWYVFGWGGSSGSGSVCRSYSSDLLKSFLMKWSIKRKLGLKMRPTFYILIILWLVGQTFNFTLVKWYYYPKFQYLYFRWTNGFQSINYLCFWVSNYQLHYFRLQMDQIAISEECNCSADELPCVKGKHHWKLDIGK